MESDVRRLDEQFLWEIDRSRNDQLNPRMDVLTVRRRRSFMGHLQGRERECQERIRFLRAKLDEDQRVLTRASKEVKVLEKLRDRQLARHRDLERRAQRAEEDEIAQSLTPRAVPGFAVSKRSAPAHVEQRVGGT